MPGVRVVTDSACDLPDELLAELGIGLVSLRIRFGSEELVDRTELSTKEFWSRCAGFDGLPETSAPSPGQFQSAFEAMAAEGADGVVCVNLSSKLSATIEAARQAARGLEGSIPVRIVDSLSVTLGQGLVAIEAAQRAGRGAEPRRGRRRGGSGGGADEGVRRHRHARESQEGADGSGELGPCSGRCCRSNR
jgi:DegV family protein with EDD domain